MRVATEIRPATVSTDRLNYLNAGLMVLTCIAAYLYPLELFLFSYAVLGPLHYFTEISWLHDRDYFAQATKARRRWLTLVSAAMCVLCLGFVLEKTGRTLNPKWEIAMVYLVFVTALTTTVINRGAARSAIVVVALISLALFSNSPPYFVIAYFLITIIHVFIFTGAFILHGALKTRSASGILSLAVFALCAVSFFVYSPGESAHRAGEYARNAYGAFQALNVQLLRLFQPDAGTSPRTIYESNAGLSVMSLIAFAYTYHYLNWFSKTSIIRWHEVSKRRVILIAVLWLLSISIYGHDYVTGMAVLYLLSILHVMLEFPLNHQTFAGIGRQLYKQAASFGAKTARTRVRRPGLSGSAQKPHA